MSKLTIIDYLDGFVGVTLAFTILDMGYELDWSALPAGLVALLIEVLFFSFLEEIRS